MPRRNQGPRLRWIDKRKRFYIVWTEHGRSCEPSTGTTDREQAEIVFANWLQRRGRREGPSDPAAILVTDVLNLYLQERGPKVAEPGRIAYAVLAFILLGLYTGRRKEAILSLRWPQVDLEAGRIDFEVSGRRRTNKKRGVIQIPPRLLPHLRRARKRGTDLGYVLHINGERIKDIKKGFEAACERAGPDGVSPHTQRHTAATWLMQAGTDVWQASGFLSMSMETLQRVYGHHHPDYQREAAENIGRRPQNVRAIRGRF
jgi:integrase